MKINSVVFLFVIASFALTSCKDVDIKEAGKELGSSAAQVGKGIGNAGKKVGHATRDFTKGVGEGAKKVFKNEDKK